MTDKILEIVNDKYGAEIAKLAEVDPANMPGMLQVITQSLMGKISSLVQSGDLNQVKELFSSGDGEQQANYLMGLRDDITKNIQGELGINPQAASDVIDKSVPKIIEVAKEKLLGADGQLGLEDLPRLMSLFS